LSNDKRINKDLLRIQKQLFNLGAILATNPDKPELLSTFNDEETVFLENSIDNMQEALSPLKNFLLPSGSLLIAQTHVSRTICRRAERKIVAIMDTNEVYKPLIKYINRLSDYLFVI
jgi:cob(I)alamin adenosyltransferase